MIDYETLKIIWWVLVGVLLIGFAIMDGHDMGVGTLLPFVGKTDMERRVIINTVGPHWDGNQVWFITGGGAIFAAWPLVYATAFSGFYWAMLARLRPTLPGDPLPPRFLRHQKAKLVRPLWPPSAYRPDQAKAWQAGELKHSERE